MSSIYRKAVTSTLALALCFGQLTWAAAGGAGHQYTGPAVNATPAPSSSQTSGYLKDKISEYVDLESAVEAARDQLSWNKDVIADPRIKDLNYLVPVGGVTLLELGIAGVYGPRWGAKALAMKRALADLSGAKSDLKKKIAQAKESGQIATNSNPSEFAALETRRQELVAETLDGKIGNLKTKAMSMYQVAAEKSLVAGQDPKTLVKIEAVFLNLDELAEYKRLAGEIAVLETQKASGKYRDSSAVLKEIDVINKKLDVARWASSNALIQTELTVAAENVKIKAEKVASLSSLWVPGQTGILGKLARGSIGILNRALIAFSLADITAKSWEAFYNHDLPGVSPVGEFLYDMIMNTYIDYDAIPGDIEKSIRGLARDTRNYFN